MTMLMVPLFLYSIFAESKGAFYDIFYQKSTILRHVLDIIGALTLFFIGYLHVFILEPTLENAAQIFDKSGHLVGTETQLIENIQLMLSQHSLSLLANVIL